MSHNNVSGHHARITADEVVDDLKERRRNALDLLRKDPQAFAAMICSPEGPLSVDERCRHKLGRNPTDIGASPYTVLVEGVSSSMLRRHHLCATCASIERLLDIEGIEGAGTTEVAGVALSAVVGAGELNGVGVKLFSTPLGRSASSHGNFVELGTFSSLVAINWVVEDRLAKKGVGCAMEYIGGFVCGDVGNVLVENPVVADFSWEHALSSAKSRPLLETLLIQIAPLAAELEAMGYTSDEGFLPLTVSPLTAVVTIGDRTLELQPSLLVHDFSKGAVNCETENGTVRLMRDSILRSPFTKRPETNGDMFAAKKWQKTVILMERSAWATMPQLEFYILLCQVLSIPGAAQQAFGCSSWVFVFLKELFGINEAEVVLARAGTLQGPNISMVPVLSGMHLRRDWQSVLSPHL